MKKTWLSLALAALAVGFSACEKGDDLVPGATSYANSSKAMEWVKDNEKQLLDEIFAKMAKEDGINVNNPDLTREVMIRIGYDGLNVAGFLIPGAYLDSLVVERIIANAKRQYPNDADKKALLITGNSSSGKSTALKKFSNPEKKAKIEAESPGNFIDLTKIGFVSDQTFENFETMKKMIAKLEANGFAKENITILYIYCDAATSYCAACDRLYRTGRTISIDYFCYMYPMFAHRIDSIEANFKDCKRIYYNNIRMASPSITDGAKIAAAGSALGTDVLADSTDKGTQGVTAWCYKLTTQDSLRLCDIAAAWAKGGDAPYNYVKNNTDIGWAFHFNYYDDEYDYEVKEGTVADKSKPNAKKIDWLLYPVSGGIFQGVSNPEKAKQSMFKNLEE